jgi:hypothetical protein
VFDQMTNYLRHRPVHPIVRGDRSRLDESPGITLRQHYAGLALQGLLAAPDITTRGARTVDEEYQMIADLAVKFADALLQSLSKD